MASTVLHFTSHLLPASGPPSLNLDLSLGSLFSHQHHACVTDCKVAAAPPNSTGPCSICNPKADIALRASVDAPPALSLHEPVDRPKPKVLQAQSWHAARKRRKSIIEEKLQKKINGDHLSGDQAHMSRLPNGAHGFEWGVPDCSEAKADHKFLNDIETVKSELRVDTSMVNSDVLFQQSGHGNIPAAVKQGIPCDLGHGMPSGVVTDVSCGLEHSKDGDVSLPIHPFTSCTLCSDGKSGSCVSFCGSNGSEIQCASYVHSQMTQYAPCVNAQKDQPVSCDHFLCTLSLYSQPAQCPALNIPTCASSSSLCTGMLFEKRPKVDDADGLDDDDKPKSCNSTLCGLENEFVRDAQSNTPNESMEAQSNRCDSKLDGNAAPVYSFVAMPGSSIAYPYALPVMPLLYPYAMPLQWGSSFPWFMQYHPQMAFGTVPSVSPSSAQLNEATSLPHSLPLNPYHRPTLHDNKASLLYSFIPGTGTENVTPALNYADSTNSFHARHNYEGVPGYISSPSPFTVFSSNNFLLFNAIHVTNM